MEPRDFVAILLLAIFLWLFIATDRRHRPKGEERDPIDWDSRQF